jgi:hypothetical protein
MSEQETKNQEQKKPTMIAGNLWDTSGTRHGPRRQQAQQEPQEPPAKASDVDAMRKEIGELQTAVLMAKGDSSILVAMRQRIQELEQKIQAKEAEPQKLVSVWTPVMSTRGRTRR